MEIRLHEVNKRESFNLGKYPNLDYSRVEVAVEARRKGCSCSYLPQILCNEEYTVRSARLKGKNVDYKYKAY